MGKGRSTVIHAVCHETIGRHLDRIAALEAEVERLREAAVAVTTCNTLCDDAIWNHGVCLKDLQAALARTGGR